MQHAVCNRMAQAMLVTLPLHRQSSGSSCIFPAGGHLRDIIALVQVHVAQVTGRVRALGHLQ